MSRPRPLRSFLWLSVFLLFFFFLDTAFLIFIEAEEYVGGKPVTWEEISEWVLLLPLNVGILALLVIMIRFVNRHMIAPLRSMAGTATRIQAGHMNERIRVEPTNREVEIVANALNEAFDRYQEVVDKLQQFSSNTSHQLRTPLAAIRNAGEVCLQKERSAMEYQDVIIDMLEDVQTLTHIIEQLLLLSRLDAEKARRLFGPVDVNSLVHQISEVYQPSCEKKGIALHVQEQAATTIVHGDHVLLQQVFANLMDNAIRYTPEGGTIVLRVESPRQGTVTCAVVDSGPGIPEGDRETVFDRFGRVATDSTQGTGLGLAIAASITRVHRGTIELAPQTVRGTDVRITLPVAVNNPDVT